MLDRTARVLGLALGAGLALAACERTDQSALRSDTKKLAEDGRAAAQNTARKVEQETKEATAQAKESLARMGDTASQIAGDAALVARVKAALLAEKDVKSADIGVDAFQGRVILRGTVPDQEQIALAARVARTIDGVKSVDNRLAVN